MKKINVAILFGGKSVEHEVSLQSGRNVAAALDPEKYNVQFIGIDKEGGWHQYNPSRPLLNPTDPKAIALGEPTRDVKQLYIEEIDVVFPALHGPLGEDGTVQGVFRLANVPFVGADVLGSAIGMDKEISKRLAREAGIATTHFLTFERSDRIDLQDLPLPLFVKPIDGGSSIGISKVSHLSQLEQAVKEAFRFSRRILIEEAIVGREIQVAVMGNENPRASLPCEIVPRGEFHSYESKYIDKTKAAFFYPAPLNPDEVVYIQTTALKIYKTLRCEGMGRVDFFLRNDGELLFNEINTLPGLTNMSPYAKMWEASGVSYPVMLDELIHHALERHQKQQKVVTQLEPIC